MALDAFQWGSKGEQLTPSQVKARNQVAAALMTQNGSPKTLGEGLSRVGDAIRVIGLQGEADASEQSGTKSAKAVMDALLAKGDPSMTDIMGAAGNDWVAESPGYAAVVNALMGQENQQQGWARQDQLTADERAYNAPIRDLQLQQGQSQLDMAPLDADYKRAQIDALTAKPAIPPTDDMKEYEAAKGQGFKGTLQDWIAIKPGSGGVTVNNNMGGSSDFYKKVDTDLGEQTAALIDAGRNASSNNMRLRKLQELLASAPQGAAGTMVQFAGQFGIPMDGLNEVQAAQAIINQMVPGQRPPGSGTMSDADLALFKASLPSIANQPGGNQLILETAKAVNEYTIAQAQIAQKVANRELTPAEGATLQAQIPNPLADFQGGAATAGGPADTPGQSKPPVISQQDYQALPSGSPFIAADDPTQTIRIKP